MGFWGNKKTNPTDAQNKGEQAFEQGDYQAARKHFTAAIDAEPSAERYYYRGVINDMLGDADSAINDLSSSVALDPESSHAFYSLAIVSYQAEKWDLAFQSIQKAYELDPDDFRIANQYAVLLAGSPLPEHQDLAKAVEVAKHGCELTNWEDEICLATYKMAMEQAGQTEDSVDVDGKLDEAAANTFQDMTVEVIKHFESSLGGKVNELALQNIVPAEVPIAVQTLPATEDDRDTVIFTTGMSSVAMKLPGDDPQFWCAEMCMLIPADWKIESEITDRNWPWILLQQLGHYPHLTNQSYSPEPQVFSMEDVPQPLVEGCEFSAFLLVPNLPGFLAGFEPKYGRPIKLIVAVPIYAEEYELGSGPSGAFELTKRLQQFDIKPRLERGRRNVAVES